MATNYLLSIALKYSQALRNCCRTDGFLSRKEVTLAFLRVLNRVTLALDPVHRQTQDFKLLMNVE
jgi:hypothetical protein